MIMIEPSIWSAEMKWLIGIVLGAIVVVGIMIWQANGIFGQDDKPRSWEND